MTSKFSQAQRREVERILRGGRGAVGHFDAGQRAGLWFEREGGFVLVGAYVSGEREGVWLRVRQDGLCVESCEYAKGQFTGLSIRYNEAGRPVEVCEMRGGAANGYCWRLPESLTFTEVFTGGECHLMVDGNIVDGKPGAPSDDDVLRLADAIDRQNEEKEKLTDEMQRLLPLPC